MNTRSFRIGSTFALTLLFLLPVMAFAAPQPQINPFSVVTPLPEWYQSDSPSPKAQNVTRVELDGLIYDLEDPALKGENIAYIVTADSQKSGIAKGFRSLEEAKAAAALAGLGCSKSDKTPTFCIFCDGLNLTGNCVIVPCGLAVNGPIRSFEIGCGVTVVCTGPDATGTCYLFTGTTGVFNYNLTPPLQYGTCFVPPPA